MKFSDCFFSPAKRRISVLFGVIAFGLALLFTTPLGALLAGAVTVLVSSVLLPVMTYAELRPYDKMRKAIPQPFLTEQRVRFTVNGGTVGGFLILTEGAVYFLSTERGKHVLQLTRKDITALRLEEEHLLRFFINNHQYVQVLTAKAQELYRLLLQQGWSATPGKD